MRNYQNLNGAIGRKLRADYNLNGTIRESYPVNSLIFWQRAGVGNVQRGNVVMHGYDERVKVQNENTSSQYWISCFDIRGGE